MSAPVVRTGRAQHAAHYGFGHPAKGHDLEWWDYAQTERLPVPEGVPTDAEYHSGYLVGDRQWWHYVRRAPLSGPACARCSL